jgi:3'-5' exoribonuclease
VKKQIYVAEINKEYAEVNDYFIVAKKGVFSSKNSTKYISVTLKDRTGTVEGKIWDDVERLNGLFDRNDIVYVKSRPRVYQEKLQLTVTDVHKADEELGLEEMRAFLPESEGGAENLRAGYISLLQEIRDPHLQALFDTLNSRQELLERFLFFPASVGVHHMYLGGLLEHSLSMARMGVQAVTIIGGDKDLVIAGCLLHDIGKVEEMGIRGGFRYSDRGRLLGHITLGVMVLEGLVAGTRDFPAEMADVLRHIIVSHHGSEEWGSPRKPMCLEALIVHYLDNLDAKVMGVKEHMKENMEDEKWTEYHRLYESRFFKLPER